MALRAASPRICHPAVETPATHTEGLSKIMQNDFRSRSVNFFPRKTLTSFKSGVLLRRVSLSMDPLPPAAPPTPLASRSRLSNFRDVVRRLSERNSVEFDRGFGMGAETLQKVSILKSTDTRKWPSKPKKFNKQEKQPNEHG